MSTIIEDSDVYQTEFDYQDNTIKETAYVINKVKVCFNNLILNKDFKLKEPILYNFLVYKYNWLKDGDNKDFPISDNDWRIHPNPVFREVIEQFKTCKLHKESLEELKHIGNSIGYDTDTYLEFEETNKVIKIKTCWHVKNENSAKQWLTWLTPYITSGEVVIRNTIRPGYTDVTIIPYNQLINY